MAPDATRTPTARRCAVPRRPRLACLVVCDGCRYVAPAGLGPGRGEPAGPSAGSIGEGPFHVRSEPLRWSRPVSDRRRGDAGGVGSHIVRERNTTPREPARRLLQAERRGPRGTGQPTQPRVVYRDGHSHVHYVTLPEVGGGTFIPVDTDVTVATGAPVATGSPFGYLRLAPTGTCCDNTQQDHLLYRDAAIPTMVRLRWSWTAADLTSLAHTSSRAAGDPVGWDEPANMQRVAYRGTDKHLHVLTWAKSTGLWKDVDVTTKLHLSATVSSDPRVSFDISEVPIQAHLYYLGSDKHAHEVILYGQAGTGSWRHVDISKAARITPALGGVVHPVGTYRLVARTTTGHVLFLERTYTGAWAYTDLTSTTHDTITGTREAQAVETQDEIGGTYLMSAHGRTERRHGITTSSTVATGTRRRPSGIG